MRMDDFESMVETLEENEDMVECKECFDLFPKVDCTRGEVGYICPTCMRARTSEQPTAPTFELGDFDITADLYDHEFPDVQEYDPESIPERDTRTLADVWDELIKDEYDAIDGYEAADEVVQHSDELSDEEKDELLDTLDHIKEEEEEHIDELKKASEDPESETPDDEDDEDEEDDGKEDADDDKEEESEDSDEELDEELFKLTGDPAIDKYNNALRYVKRDKVPYLYGYTKADGEAVFPVRPVKIEGSQSEFETKYREENADADTLRIAYPDKNYREDLEEEESETLTEEVLLEKAPEGALKVPVLEKNLFIAFDNIFGGKGYYLDFAKNKTHEFHQKKFKTLSKAVEAAKIYSKEDPKERIRIVAYKPNAADIQVADNVKVGSSRSNLLKLNDNTPALVLVSYVNGEPHNGRAPQKNLLKLWYTNYTNAYNNELRTQNLADGEEEADDAIETPVERDPGLEDLDEAPVVSAEAIALLDNLVGGEVAKYYIRFYEADGKTSDKKYGPYAKLDEYFTKGAGRSASVTVFFPVDLMKKAHSAKADALIAWFEANLKKLEAAAGGANPKGSIVLTNYKSGKRVEAEDDNLTIIANKYTELKDILEAVDMDAVDDEPDTETPVDADTPVEEEVTFTVTFEGAEIPAATVKKGEKVAKPEDPAREGFEFKGWFNGEAAYDFDAAVEADLTLTAKWEEVKPTESTDSEEPEESPEESSDEEVSEAPAGIKFPNNLLGLVRTVGGRITGPGGTPNLGAKEIEAITAETAANYNIVLGNPKFNNSHRSIKLSDWIKEINDQKFFESWCTEHGHVLVEAFAEDEKVNCGWCDQEFDRSECRKEVQLGWLCPYCESAIKSRGETLTFEEPGV